MGSVLSFSHVGSGDRTHISRLGSKYPDLLSNLTSPYIVLNLFSVRYCTCHLLVVRTLGTPSGSSRDCNKMAFYQWHCSPVSRVLTHLHNEQQGHANSWVWVGRPQGPGCSHTQLTSSLPLRQQTRGLTQR